MPLHKRGGAPKFRTCAVPVLAHLAVTWPIRQIHASNASAHLLRVLLQTPPAGLAALRGGLCCRFYFWRCGVFIAFRLNLARQDAVIAF